MVILEEEDRKELVRLYKTAETTPVITLGCDQKSFAEGAWDNVREKMDELGKKYGFDPKAMKGIDAKTGEIML